MAFDPDAAAGADSGLFGLPFQPDEAHVVVVPVPFEATTSYRAGTARGPEAILEASRQVDLFHGELGRIYAPGIAMLPIPEAILRLDAEARAAALPVIEAGGVDDAASPDLRAALERVNTLSTQLNGWVHAETERWLARDKFVAVLGGDHSVPLGAIAAHAERFPGMGVLHLDAHADLRVAYEGFTYSHASIMYNVCAEVPGVSRIVQVGVRDFGEREARFVGESDGRVLTHFDGDLQRRLLCGTPWDTLCREIVAHLPEQVYLSWDIDGLDPVLCPNTGTPVPGGLSFAQAVHLLRTLVASGRRIVGLDLVEVAPGPDGDEWDANVGARLLYTMIGFALRSRGRL
jgi:agmatinase